MSQDSGSVGFLAELARAPDLWRSADVRTIATKYRGGWCNLVTRCQLDARAPDRIPRLSNLPQGYSISAVQQIIPIDQLPEALRDIEAGYLQFAEHLVSFRAREKSDSEDSPRPYYPGRPGFSPLYNEFRLKPELPWSEITLFMSGDQIHEFFRDQPYGTESIDHELRTLAHPFDGLDGFAKLFVRESRQLRNLSTHVSVLAPLQARFERSASRLRETLRVRVVAGSDSVRSCCTVGYSTVDGEGMPLTGSLDLDPSAWRRDGGTWIQDLTVPPPPAASVAVLLRVGAFCTDRLVLSNSAPVGQNAALDAYQTLDPDLDILREGLATGGKAKSKGFEQAVSRLLTVCGFRVDFLGGDTRLSDAADCLAYAEPEQIVLVTECTAGAIDSGGKLGKLHTRVREIASALPGHTVLGVVATMSSLEDIASQEISRAGADGLAVLTQADYPELLELAEANRPVSQAIALIRSRIPVQQSDRTASVRRFLGG